MLCCKKKVCNIMDKLPYLEESIGKRISEIDSKIRDLKSERYALERLLLDARKENVENTEAVRRNSGTRILVENSIMKTLRRSLTPVSNRDLYQNAKLMVFDLKENTFRSHIKRMKDAGKIVPKGKRWVLPEAEGGDF
jgi:hypothetical protein